MTEEAVRNVTQKILPALRGLDALDQLTVDHTMLKLDGTDVAFPDPAVPALRAR